MPSATAVYGGGGRYLKAAELPLNKRINVVIERCEARVVRDQKSGKDKDMLALVLKGKDKELLLNQTNNLTLVAAFGDDYSLWGNHPIQIWAQIVSTPQGNQPGIRLAANGGGTPLPAPNPTPRTAEEEAMADDDLNDSIPF
jgi:hypothetical protein